MTIKRKILIIEDEKDISRIVRDYLNTSGFEAMIAGNGRDGLDAVEGFFPDFIILDIMLPDIDGIEVCRQIRERNNVPILILSARGSDTDKVIGLGFGADDYVTKPFSLHEIVARIKAYFRRHESTFTKPAADDVLCVGNISINKKAYSVTVDGQDISFSAKEFELLHYLASHQNQVFSKSQLLDAVWGYASYGDENTVTVYVSRIREKIEANPSKPTYLKTVWGVGYKCSYHIASEESR